MKIQRVGLSHLRQRKSRSLACARAVTADNWIGASCSQFTDFPAKLYNNNVNRESRIHVIFGSSTARITKQSDLIN